MMDLKQFVAHQEKAKQGKCEKLNKLAKVHGAKVVPMTEWEEEVAPLSEKAAKLRAKVVPLTEEEKETSKINEKVTEEGVKDTEKEMKQTEEEKEKN